MERTFIYLRIPLSYRATFPSKYINELLCIQMDVFCTHKSGRLKKNDWSEQWRRKIRTKFRKFSCYINVRKWKFPEFVVISHWINLIISPLHFRKIRYIKVVEFMQKSISLRESSIWWHTTDIWYIKRQDHSRTRIVDWHFVGKKKLFNGIDYKSETWMILSVHCATYWK